MKIIVMGGAGDMGSRTVEDLAFSEGVERVTIADRNLVRARELAENLAAAPASVMALPVDATDRSDLVRSIKGHDVIASALGPFYLFETRLMRAALEAGVDYISICDDWPAAQDAIIRYDEKARAQGRFLVTGCGASPGMVNIGVRYLADKLDRPRKADIYIYLPMDSGEGEANVKHMLFIYGTLSPVLRDGAITMIQAGSIVKRVEFPKYGIQKVWNIGHAEPVTLPRFIHDLEEVNIMAGLGKGTEIIVGMGRMGLFSNLRRIDLMSRLLLMVAKAFPSKPGPEPEGSILMKVAGEKDGCETVLMLCGTGTMRECTGIALSVGVKLLAQKKLIVETGGVYGPEGCFDPVEFLDMLSEKGIYVYTDLDMKERIN